jgi:hypothetical protein
MKKKPEIKYGIKIVKPWSSEMYDHNDVVSEEMKMNILDAWKKELSKITGGVNNVDIKLEDWDEDMLNHHAPILVKLQRGIMYSGYGDGYSIQDVNDEFERELEDMPNFQLHESYSYLAFEGLLDRTSFMLVGYEWQKFDYHIIGSQECTSPVLSLSFHNDKS